MTAHDPARKEEESQPAKSKKPDDKSAPPVPKDSPKPAGLNFKFKFAPADPKNSFDFEDTADK